jgi:hypothetical protein
VSALSNQQFLQSLLIAVSSLLLSAAILVPGYLSFVSVLHPELAPYIDTRPARTRTFTGSSFKPVYGKGRQEGSATLVTELNGDRAIIARRAYLKASDYPFLRCDMDGQHPGMEVFFFWRTQQVPSELFQQKAHWTCDNGRTLNLTQSDDWTGTITEIGLVVVGELRSAPLMLNALSVEPFSNAGMLEAIWGEWTAFEPWTQTSVFAYRGVPTNWRGLLYPVPSLALWAGLATTIGCLMTLLLQGRNTRKGKTNEADNQRYLPMATITVTLAWLALDTMWQDKLWQQNAETRYQFAGKTHDEKLLADWDGKYYAFAKHIKHNILPAEPQNIVVLAAPNTPNAFGSRLRYHLLPEHQVNVDHSWPRRDNPDYHYAVNAGQVNAARKEQYFILMTTSGQDARTADLYTLADITNDIQETLVYANEVAALYRVVPAQEGKP